MEKQMFVNNTTAKIRWALRDGEVRGLQSILDVAKKSGLQEKIAELWRGWKDKPQESLTPEQETICEVIALFEALNQYKHKLNGQRFKELEELEPHLAPFIYSVTMNAEDDVPVMKITIKEKMDEK